MQTYQPSKQSYQPSTQMYQGTTKVTQQMTENSSVQRNTQSPQVYQYQSGVAPTKTYSPYFPVSNNSVLKNTTNVPTTQTT